MYHKNDSLLCSQESEVQVGATSREAWQHHVEWRVDDVLDGRRRSSPVGVPSGRDKCVVQVGEGRSYMVGAQELVLVCTRRFDVFEHVAPADRVGKGGSGCSIVDGRATRGGYDEDYRVGVGDRRHESFEALARRISGDDGDATADSTEIDANVLDGGE